MLIGWPLLFDISLIVKPLYFWLNGSQRYAVYILKDPILKITGFLVKFFVYKKIEIPYSTNEVVPDELRRWESQWPSLDFMRNKNAIWYKSFAKFEPVSLKVAPSLRSYCISVYIFCLLYISKTCCFLFNVSRGFGIKGGIANSNW